MANDPNTIQYVIQEDGFWYVASKDRTPGVPEITVSAKGVANGLSSIPNDGADFGPDSYDPSYSGSGIPYTSTSGIQEALTYAVNQGGATIQLLDDEFDVTDAPFFTSNDGSCTYQIMIPEVQSDTQITIALLGAGVSSGLLEKTALTNRSGGTVIKSLAPTQPTVTVGSWILGSNDSSYSTTGQNFIRLYIDGISFVVADNSNVGGFCGFRVMGLSGGSLQCYTDYSGTSPTTLNQNPRGAMILGHGTEGDANIHISQVSIFGFQNGLNCGSSLHIGVLEIGYCVNGIYNDANNLDNAVVVIDYYQIGLTAIPILNETTGVRYFYIGMWGIGDGTTNSSLPYYLQYFIKDTTGSMTVKGVLGGTYNSSILLNNLEAYMDIAAGGTVDFAIMPNLKNTAFIAPSISPNPPVSGTAYQNTNPYAIEIDLPVYATTAGTAGYVTIAKGATDTPTAIGNQYVSGDTSDTSEQIIRLRVPAGWYYEFTASGVTFGTASVFAD